VWFGRILFFFTYYRGRRRAADGIPALVPADGPRLRGVAQPVPRAPGLGAGHGPHYDVVELERILCPVLQPDPCEPNSWWLNHYVAPYNM